MVRIGAQLMAQHSFDRLPGRLLVDTCVLCLLHDHGEFIFDGHVSDGNPEPNEDLESLRTIMMVNARASFQFLVSPIVIAELANEQRIDESYRRLSWVLEVLNMWLTMLDECGDRVAKGRTVRHRFTLPQHLQAFEERLMQIPDFRRDPMDRLLLLQYKMGNCDAFLTVDRGTIWIHRDLLLREGIKVMTPTDLLNLLRPWLSIWH